ncbi:hypothetical protein FJR30_04770 [Francisella tularensis]|nr:hypothetical protein [Francisella tularensis]
MIKKYFDSRSCLILAVFIGLGSPIIVESFVEEKKYSSNKIGIDTQYIVNPKDICRNVIMSNKNAII